MDKRQYLSHLTKNSEIETWRNTKENILILLNQKPRYKLEVIKLICSESCNCHNKNAIHKHFKDLVEMDLIERCYPKVTGNDGRAKTRQYYKIKKPLVRGQN